MLKKTKVAFAVLYIVCFCCCFSFAQGENLKISDYSEVVLNPFMREPDDYYSESKLSIQDNGLDYTNYWIQTVIAITKMRYDYDYEYAKKIIDCEIDTFARYGYFPRPEYQDFQYGWVSSMDAPVIAVASLWLYEETQEEKYLVFTKTLSDYILQDVRNHGFVGTAKGKRWLYEYAGVNTTEEAAEFVLNGSLLGTLATAIIAKKTDNDDLNNLVEEQIENYKLHSDLYLYRGNSWCYYELNEKRVNQPHYVIYEIRLLDALYEVTGDSWFEKQASIRREALLSYYQGFVIGEELFFLRAGAPHYYYIDVFDTVLQFEDKEGNILLTSTASGRSISDSIIRVKIPLGTDHINWISHTEYYDVYIGTIRASEMTPETMASTIEFVAEASTDGSIDNKTICIKPSTGKTNLICRINTPMVYEFDDVFVLELENLSGRDYSMNIILYDSEDRTIERYLPQLNPGKNSIQFSLPGFVEGDADLLNVKYFYLRIYASGEEKIQIKVGNLYKFDNSGEYMQYLMNTEYVPVWQR